MGRSPTCCDNNSLKKGPWTPEEDQKLIQYIQLNGPGNWRKLPKNAGLQRCGKSCRLRWTNYLRPDIKRGRFSFEEEEAIIQLHSVLGNKWSAIASRLPGRTDNEIKNYWNTHIRKRLLKMGIDPVTHSPRLDLVDLLNALSSARRQLNYSNSLGLQPLVNPEVLNFFTSLLASNQENQVLENIQLQNCSILQQSNQFQEGSTSSCFPSSMEVITPDVASLNSNVSQQNLTPYDLSVVNLPNTDYIASDDHHQQISNLLTNEGMFGSMNNINDQNFTGNPVISTTNVSSPTQLNSSSTFVNGSVEDDIESYCSSFLKFQFPDSSFDHLGDFM